MNNAIRMVVQILSGVAAIGFATGSVRLIQMLPKKLV
jgi:hypothetical protein